MSKTFTSRPSVTNRPRGSTRGTGNQAATRGAARGASTGRGAVGSRSVRGRVNPSTRGGMYNQDMGSRGGRGGAYPRRRGGTHPPRPGGTYPPRPGEEDEGGTGDTDQRGAGTTDQTVSHQGAYSVISPNEKKRKQISEQARRETEAYERHKAENKPGHVSYHGTVGGGEMTETEARSKMAMTNASAKFNMLERQRKRKEEEKRHLEEEFSKKKMDARRKTENNERRAQREDEKKREEMETIKNKFLDRFEQPAPKDVPPKASNPSSSSNISIPSRSSDPQPRSHPANERRQLEQDHPMRDRNTDHMTPEMNSDLETLHAMFPQFPVSAIKEIYSQSGSLEVTAELLADR
ncbi:epithelial-stromal interaction protein 1-like [Haliotis rufescens]|uniref:epithelial-stromal interaction protein 1-like n=1 Tax=Haliotis rufescens TaxID=6454 RepID=UPI00201EEA33|nr:epithelial-stromal interaction protein 1-like [Haliotis rufescens]